MKRLTLLFLCLFVLTGCSTKIAYNFMGFFLRWQVDSYVSLDKEQKQATKAAIKEFHAWHRETQLVRYADFMDELVVRLNEEPVTGQSIHAETDRVQDLLDDSTNKLIPAIVDIASTFSDEQVEELLAQLAKEREEYKEDYVDAGRDKVAKKHIKDMRGYAKQFFGRLTDEQEAMIEQWAQNVVPYEHYSLQQQEISAQTLAKGLAHRQDKVALEQTIRELMFYRSDDWIPEYEAITDQNQVLTYNMLAELYNSQTDRQRKKTIKKLRNYQEDFLELAKEVNSRSSADQLASIQ